MMTTQALFQRSAVLFVIVIAILLQTSAAQAASPKIGIVLMRGKSGSPTRYVDVLASSLEGKDCLVANLEMPWSGRRQYDTDVAGAEKEVQAALDGLRAKGATHLFVAGHSQGGLFALYFGGRQPVHGIVAIAPGGNVANLLYREKLGASLEQARQLLAEGKGNEPARLKDSESSRGTYPLDVTPANYLSWFDPGGAMNQSIAVRKLNPQTPVLYIVPRNDYPGLLTARQPMFDALPRHPLTRLYEPASDHVGAPSASADEIPHWTMDVVAQSGNAIQKP